MINITENPSIKLKELLINSHSFGVEFLSTDIKLSFSNTDFILS